ncbi:ABC transporter ATP-binding protein [Sporolactobacillus sp. CQH2019]|uniref:ABC transporter ATP-binding protein n=1 Tax=Sporolactobacillus sp. CQH2019 TaxID=3023512 RepID=UPI0023681779|nr:ABC transporter ATP-binding protein [Sporolactobacillus sp. CQH2019]MDD9148302.1 ABC transporter ATP-binding protein [Sporolactobacillus sp. CQH2019]
MIINANHVSWRRQNKEVLKDVTWHVRRGEHWSLVGLNGSGKTTLLKMINGYIWPSSGTLSVLDMPFGKGDLRELRKKIGWVSSALGNELRPHELPEEIVLSGKFASIGLYEAVHPQDVRKAKELLELMHCSPFASRPYGTLSQGEKQRVLIARAMMASPELLILDEPCNGLDIFARERLLTLIEGFTESENAPTMIFITHHVGEILPCFSHTLLLKEGAVYQSGLTADIMTPENMTAFYGGGVIVERHGGRLSMAIRS